jgi:hypothetical protein
MRDLNADNISAQGCFEAIHYTGAFEKAEMEVTPSGVRQVKRKLEKIEASHFAIASLLLG